MELEKYRPYWTKDYLMGPNSLRVLQELLEKNPCPLNADTLSLPSALEILKTEYSCNRITIQCGGTLNSLFLREKLFDYVDLVVAPVLIGGKDTATLIDGNSLMSEKELNQLGVLQLQNCTVLEDSYLRLRYRVIS